jgi:predicted RNA-binding protein with PIN domain
VSEHFVIDGYSVIHAWPKLRRMLHQSAERAREALIRIAQSFADQKHARVTVVFDGKEMPFEPKAESKPRHINVIFSRCGQTADAVIERLVANAAPASHIVVVTNDNLERHTVEALGGRTMSAEGFAAATDAAATEFARYLRAHRRKAVRPMRGERMEEQRRGGR